MFSKEWKVIALCAVAVMSLTACPKNKKKSKEGQSVYKGLWVNAEAYRELLPVSIGQAQDPNFCQMLWMNARRLGINANSLTGVSLDAWVIHANGDVYRYSAYNNSASHGYRNPQYREGHLNGSNCRRDNNGYGSFGGFCSSQSLLHLDRDILSVSGGYAYGGGTSEVYVRPRSAAELEHISAVIATCRTMNNRLPHGAPQQAPVLVPGQPLPPGQAMPQQLGPQVGPPGQQQEPNFK